MMLIYKIHPAVGVGRVGDSPDKFFVGPEKPGDPGVEIQANDSETSILQGFYKDSGQIKRQAARFRIFEYDRDATGHETLTREITADQAKITWKVDLVNRKAALDHTPPSNGIDPRVAARPRNPTIVGAARQDLIIHDDRDHTITGRKQSGVKFDQGKFLGKTVPLGELRTDAAGRLLVLGGHGVSGSVPPGQLTTGFANNNRWHDDVSDGPVTATVEFDGSPARPVDAPAWVVFGPPDFAPGIGGLVTLYDVAFQAAITAGFRHAEAQPTFPIHILPMIQRASRLQFVGDQNDPSTGSNYWAATPTDPSLLNDTSSAAKPIRERVVDALTSPIIETILSDAVIPNFLKTYLNQYKAGTFHTGIGSPTPVETAAETLDRAALEACVGLNFFPGIEASQTIRGPIYSEAFRFNQALPQVKAGFLTEVMACPWQADFDECRGDWWPSQRPDMVMTNPNNIPGSRTTWAAGINSRDEMVAKFATLPFVVPATSSTGKAVFIRQ